MLFTFVHLKAVESDLELLQLFLNCHVAGTSYSLHNAQYAFRHSYTSSLPNDNLSWILNIVLK